MSFTESAMVKKLLELIPSQQSIQTLSYWLIHHRKHHSRIVKTWYKEMQRVPPNKKLTFMYLANDVIQNSKKKGPELGKEYGLLLNKAFQHIAQTCSDDSKTISSLDRILNIWGERGVYETTMIDDYRKFLHAGKSTGSSATVKRKSEDEKKSDSSNKTPQKRVKSSNSEHVKSETIEVNGKVETHVTLSPHIPAGDPPEPEDLIKAILALEHSASSDAVIRERIVNLPPEISELNSVSKIEDKEAAVKLANQVNDAINLLNDYNGRLSAEMDDRRRLACMLKDFQAEQRELLAQAEQRLEEYTSKLRKAKEIQQDIKNHLQNLPDLSQLPDVTGGLAPLPSAGDLFNIH